MAPRKKKIWIITNVVLPLEQSIIGSWNKTTTFSNEWNLYFSSPNKINSNAQTITIYFYCIPLSIDICARNAGESKVILVRF